MVIEGCLRLLYESKRESRRALEYCEPSTFGDGHREPNGEISVLLGLADTTSEEPDKKVKFSLNILSRLVKGSNDEEDDEGVS